MKRMRIVKYFERGGETERYMETTFILYYHILL
jgi:hypothetical protein